jgi:acylglycerol lipase
MTRYKDAYKINDDQGKLFVREWLPEKDPVAVILHLHGLGEHSGRMDHWAERFVRKNIGFISYDQRGHGKSDGKKGSPKHSKKLIEDCKMMVSILRDEYPDIPVILYGHSLGGNIAINYVISSTLTVDALIATSPWLKLTNPPSKALLKILQPLLKIAPGMTISNGLDHNDISRVEEEVQKYTNDPLVHGKISIGLFNSIHEGGLNALRNVYKINCPFLLMHGTADNICSPKASEEYVMNTSDRTRLKLWEGGYHELHHDTVHQEVFDYIIQWFKESKIT